MSNEQLLIELKEVLQFVTVRYMEDDWERNKAIARINDQLNIPQEISFCGCSLEEYLK